MAPYLSPVEKPRGLLLKLVYFATKRQFGKVSTPIAVFSARMPTPFLNFYGKVSRLDKKLVLSSRTASLVRERVASINGCAFCMDAARFYATRQSPDSAALFDALPDYATSTLFTEAERAALDYASVLCCTKQVDPETFERLARHHSEREICDIVWLVASEHVYNLTNIGLGIGSDGMCEIPPRKVQKGKASATALSG